VRGLPRQDGQGKYVGFTGIHRAPVRQERARGPFTPGSLYPHVNMIFFRPVGGA
jgi:hypothetical protein